MKVALVHDYLREYGGAERVLEALHQIFPQAPIYVAYYNPQGLGPHRSRIEKWDIRSSWLQNFPFANKLLSPFRIFAPLIFENFDLSEYDLVISSCAIYFSKAVITKPETLHISYIHTPPRYLYGFTTSFNYKKNIFTHIAGEIANHFLRIYDFETSQRPDLLIANSQNVQARIKKFYRRDAKLIYPPVYIQEFQKIKSPEGQYFLSLSRLARGKGTEVVVQACTKLNLPLKVVGTGPELDRLKKIAGETVEFLGEVPDEERVVLYAKAKALIAASEDEDFGITVVEAMASGTPVIAARAGGYLETVIEGKTGEFFDITKRPCGSKDYVDQELVNNLIKILQNFDPQKYQEDICRKQAQKFSFDEFKKKILSCQNFQR